MVLVKKGVKNGAFKNTTISAYYFAAYWSYKKLKKNKKNKYFRVKDVKTRKTGHTMGNLNEDLKKPIPTSISSKKAKKPSKNVDPE